MCIFLLVQARKSLKDPPTQSPSWSPTKLHSTHARITRSTTYSPTPCVASRRYPSAAVITGTATAAAPFESFEPHIKSYHHGYGGCRCCSRCQCQCGPAQVPWGASDVCTRTRVVSVRQQIGRGRKSDRGVDEGELI